MSAMTDPASVYPAALRLAGRRAVVIGAGPVAQRRVLGLLDARADVLVIAPEATPLVAPNRTCECYELRLFIR